MKRTPINTTLVGNRAPTHRCKECGALWIQFTDSWSLCSAECGECCDNAGMGDQIEPLFLSDVLAITAPLHGVEFGKRPEYKS